MNKQSLTDRVRRFAKDKDVSPTLIYIRFFFDSFLERLSVSKYANNFVLKGGLYLSSLLSIERRATMDIDFLMKRMELNFDSVTSCIKEIINIDIDDGVTFSYEKSESIREDDVYGGVEITLEGHLENIRQKFSLDVVTADPIIPSEIQHKYECLLTGKQLALKAYSLESFIAEKLETILAKKEGNSRSKDFYDIYVIERGFLKNISLNNLKLAFEATCKHRGFNYQRLAALSSLDSIVKNAQMQRRWESFVSRMKYAKGISLNDTLNSCKTFIELIG